MALFDFAKDILGIGAAATGIAGVLGRRGKSPAEKAMGAQLERANQLSAALTNYNDPMRANIREQQLQMARDARMEGMRDFINASTRAARRNPFGPGFIARNPRRDEAVMRAMTMASQNEAAQADMAARQELMGALGGNINAASASGRGADMFAEMGARRASALPSAFLAGRDLAGALQRTFQPAQPAQTVVNINDPNAMGPGRRSVTTSRTGGLLGWV